MAAGKSSSSCEVADEISEAAGLTGTRIALANRGRREHRTGHRVDSRDGGKSRGWGRVAYLGDRSPASVKRTWGGSL